MPLSFGGASIGKVGELLVTCMISKKQKHNEKSSALYI